MWPHIPPTPAARTVDVVDNHHGTLVADPYRWLEDGDAAEVRAWTDAQNERSRAVFDAYPGHGALLARMKALLDVGSLSAPAVRTLPGGASRYFYTRREAGQNQRIFYVRDGRDGAERSLIDIASMSIDATSALDWTSPSPDGALVAWGRSEGGTEESTLFVRDVASGKDLPDVIPHTRFASIAWLPDGKSFFYTRYPTPGSVPKGDEKYWRQVFLHVIGTDPHDDPLIFPDPTRGCPPGKKTDSPRVILSPNGRWLVVRVHQGPRRAEVHVRDLADGDAGTWRPIAVDVDARFDPIPRDDALYMVTNEGAPRSRLVRIDYSDLRRSSWREIIPERPNVLRGATIIGDVIVARYTEEAATRLERWSLAGEALGPLTLPKMGSATVRGAPDGREAFVNFSSFVVPGEVICFDLASGEASTWGRVGAPLPGVLVSRLYATSKDGTRIPMFVVEREGTPRDSSAPTILTGYGGFNQIAAPVFSECALAAVERGAVWVLAVLRGGGEFGDDWHRAGILERKQNTFDDFIACAEELIRMKITSSSRLAILGSSNGGLLTAAVVTQRPDLFRAALCDVALTDMLRYQHFRIARLWIPEYGSAEDPDQFRTLHAYSPYHRIVDGTLYPSMLFTTAVSDSRVDPMHARKMAARMQAAQPNDPSRPILVRIEAEAGHGGGKPMSKLAEEFADGLTFLFQALDIQ